MRLPQIIILAAVAYGLYLLARWGVQNYGWGIGFMSGFIVIAIGAWLDHRQRRSGWSRPDQSKRR